MIYSSLGAEKIQDVTEHLKVTGSEVVLKPKQTKLKGKNKTEQKKKSEQITK